MMKRNNVLCYSCSNFHALHSKRNEITKLIPLYINLPSFSELSDDSSSFDKFNISAISNVIGSTK